MKLCPHLGPRHGEKPCALCWPLLRFPQPLSPRDAEQAMGDLAWNPKWRGFALSLAEQMMNYWLHVAAGATTEHHRDRAYECNAWWRGVVTALGCVLRGTYVRARTRAVA